MRPNRETILPRVASVLEWDLTATSKSVEKLYPDTWRRIHTRTIESPPDFYGSKVLSVGVVSAIEELRGQRGMDSNIGIIAGVLEEFDFPTYYVSRPLVEALKRSNPPENLTWADLQLPFKALTFMVPRGSLVEPPPTGLEIACVGVAKLLANEVLSVPTLPNPVGPLDYDRICIFWILGPGGLEMNDSTFPCAHPLEPLGDWIDAKSEGRPYVGPPGAFSAKVAALVANFILVMESRRELVEHGKLISKPAREGRPGLYSPTFIGRNYAVIRKDQEGQVDRQAKFTELGWRAGHFKRQRFGQKNELQKTIFVDPYIAYSKGLQKL